MAILIDERKRVLVQGITGREGRARARLMREYGTNVVAGVTPGKGGQTVLGVPVFNTPQEAVKSLGKMDISVVFVPAAGVKDAAISAIEAGIQLTVLVPDRVPVWDAMEIAAAAKANGAMFLGPNTLGVLSPGKGVAGMICGRDHRRRPRHACRKSKSVARSGRDRGRWIWRTAGCSRADSQENERRKSYERSRQKCRVEYRHHARETEQSGGARIRHRRTDGARLIW